MPKSLLSMFYQLLSALIIASIAVVGLQFIFRPTISGAPPYGESESEIPKLDPYAWLNDWTRPEGPPSVALQVGHWKNQEVPEELVALKRNTGASGGGKSEWEVNYAIALEIQRILQTQGVKVELLPATVPPQYFADAFIAIHADGNLDPTISGFKIAPPWRDFSGNASTLSTLLEKEYADATKLRLDPNISRNMRGYYAFSWWRYEHAIHPMTTAVIVETGFLTNAHDRTIIVQQPELAGAALARGILQYLETQKLL